MRDEKLRARINELAGGSVVMLDSPSFDRSVVGISYDDRVIYSWRTMVLETMHDYSCSYNDATEFISYSILRATPYMNDNSPIIVMYDRSDIREG